MGHMLRQNVTHKCGFKEMCRPLHATNPTSSDYHLFPNLKQNFHEQTFSTDNELKYVPEESLKDLSEVFYFVGKEKHRDHYILCTDRGGDCIKK